MSYTRGMNIIITAALPKPLAAWTAPPRKEEKATTRIVVIKLLRSRYRVSLRRIRREGARRAAESPSV